VLTAGAGRGKEKTISGGSARAMLRGVVVPVVRIFALIGLSAFFYDVSDEP
jgi:hypothetical protein